MSRSAPTYRLGEDADVVLDDHMSRLAKRWGKPKRKALLEPNADSTEMGEYVIVMPASKREARRFAAIVRDARHYLEVHGYHREDIPGLDAKIAKQFRVIEQAVESDWGPAADMKSIERWFRRGGADHMPSWASGIVILSVIVGAVYLVRSCT
jgi:hypothetical protein